jgi:E3 SUMO-protein ligase PIAS1
MILSALNEECGTNFFKTGKKQELIDRVTFTLEQWRQRSETEKWTKAKTILYQIRNNGKYVFDLAYFRDPLFA